MKECDVLCNDLRFKQLQYTLQKAVKRTPING